jgi:antitoxin ChpS
MKTALRTIGNSKGAVIPASLLRELNLNVGDELNAQAVDGSLVLTPSRKTKYSLADLLAQCDSSAPMPEELASWDGMKSVGNEI